MRFVADGPDFPGDLLDARDEGQVIFFCGAGVSRAEAGGPSFRELAERVVTKLGSSGASPARQLLALTTKIDPLPGVGGIPPADRIFALLEQEFPVAEVRRAVAQSVRPCADAGLGPHKSLIDLSRAPDGAVRLVTTNFDLLFEQASPGLAPIVPPSLPDPARPGELAGIIHLHGVVSDNYAGPASPEFVLSAADFGRAYLAEGWATAFMRTLIARYRIVFVGYSADDPPMQYLLEALQPSTAPGSMYALQDGDASRASGLWRHKGVNAIPFQDFPALWESLGIWAGRARDPDGWRRDVATMAVPGPRTLLPHQRGQVAHLVSSSIGAKLFAGNDPPPPAEWLCVFDPQVRYDRPRPINWRDPKPEQFDPFASYGLDGEMPPTQALDKPRQTAAPKGSWSAFEAFPGERSGGRSPTRASLRGLGSTLPPTLPIRLWRLAQWFGRVSDDPIALWWASGQVALHPDMIFQVDQGVMKDGVAPEIRTAWRMVLAALEEPEEEERDPYDFERRVNSEGWSRLSVEKLIEIERPRLTVSRPLTPPTAAHTKTDYLVQGDVSYPGHVVELEVPDELLANYLVGTRHNVHIATQLEEEVGGFALVNLSPLNPFQRAPNEFAHDPPNLSGLMAHLANLVRRILTVSPELARHEVTTWRNLPGTPFRNLRVWAAAEPGLTSAREAASILLSLGDDVWDSRLERDLLTAAKARWDELSAASRRRFERITLAGPAPWEGVNPRKFEPYRINAILRRLVWMEREGIAVSFDLRAKLRRLSSVLPEWSAEDAAERLDRPSSRGGWIATDKTHTQLLDIPLDLLLAQAENTSGRGKDFLVESRPFRGLVEVRPVKALGALRRAADRNETWAWAWTDLLWSDARDKDGLRYRCLVARRLLGLPKRVLAANLRSAVEWFTRHARPIWETERDLYLSTWHMLASAIECHESDAGSSFVVRGSHDWVAAAINSPSGRLANLLFDEIAWNSGDSNFDENWKARAERLLGLPKSAGAYAAAMITRRTNWLHEQDLLWVHQHLIPLIEWGAVVEAARYGYLQQAGFPTPSLFMYFKWLWLKLLSEGKMPVGNGNLVKLILVGWFRRGGRDRLVSSEELRESLIETSEENRLHALRTFANWSNESEEWAAQTTEFLQDAWPRQLAARSPAASAALVELALRAGDRMPEVTAAVLPLIESTAEPIDVIRHVRTAQGDQLSKFPEEHLALLYAILPEDAQAWPWGMTPMVDHLAEIPSIKNDLRLSDLRRRVARA